MADLDFISAKIALGGDAGNVIFRGPDRPVSWPEVRVLQLLHGDDNVFDCDFVKTEQSNVQMEKMRLLALYGAEPVNLCYPGARPFMELKWPGERGEPGLTVKRPERRPVPGSEPVEEPEIDLPALKRMDA